MPYVEGRVAKIVAEAADQHRRPLLASKTEIMRGMHEDVLACMRELHHRGEYRGTNILNQPALIKE